jgi:hypothetical protein
MLEGLSQMFTSQTFIHCVLAYIKVLGLGTCFGVET